MKKFLSMAFVGLMMATALTSCKKDEVTDTKPVLANKEMSQTQQIAAYLIQKDEFKNMGNGAVFVTPDYESANFSVLKDIEFDPILGFTAGEAASFGAPYGDNSFWILNPNGTYTIHLVSQEADATHEDLATGEIHAGTGHCNFNYTGEYQTFTLPFPPFEVTILILSDQSAVSVHGKANVTLNGEPGPSKKLRMKWVTAPSGQGGVDLSLQ